MWLEYIHLRQFRNYSDLQLVCDPHKNLFIGENAAGKTNILESIYYLSHGRSQRTRLDRELIGWEQPFATIKLQAQSHRHGGQVVLEAQLTLTPQNTLKTVFKYNGQPVRSRSDVVGKIPTVTFFLNDLQMLRGAPEDRRNALDSALVQYDPAHFKRMSAYQKVRQQKSGLLKQPPQSIDPMVFDSLNQQLSITGAVLIQARLDYLRQVHPMAAQAYARLSQCRDQLEMQYVSSIPLSDVLDMAQIQDFLYQAIQARQADEYRRGQVLVGPHRDDVQFFLDGKDASHFGSQGQQRSIVLAMKLAEIQLLKQQLQDETPVLLLDDVMAELDPSRQQMLLEHLDPGMQVFLTTTHLDNSLKLFLEGSGSVRVFEVAKGTVKETEIICKGAPDVAIASAQ